MSILVKNESLSLVEAQIVDKINDNPQFFLKLNLLEFADYVTCSKSVVSRVVQKLNFENYAQMKLFIQEKVVLNSFFDISENQTTTDRLNNLKAYNNFAINMTLEEIDPKYFKEIVKQILNSRKVFVFGISSSFLAARELSTNLFKIGLNTSCSENIHDAILMLAEFNKNDLIILFSKSGNNKEIDYLIEMQKQYHYKTLIITTNEEVAQLCDYGLIFQDLSKPTRLIATSSKMVQLVLADAIFYEVYYSNKNKHEKIMDNSAELLKKWKSS